MSVALRARLLVFIWSFVASSAAVAQRTSDTSTPPAKTIAQATVEAVAGLPDVAAAGAARAQVAAQRRGARSPFVGPPVASGSLEIGNEGLSEQDAGLTAQLRWPGEGRAARLAADKGDAVIDAALDNAKLEVAGDVRNAWWALASAVAILAVQREQAALAGQEVVTVSRLVGAGVQARRDLLLAQAERAAIDGRVSAAQSDFNRASARYESLVGSIPTQFPAERVGNESVDIDDHPAIRAALASAAAAEARALVSRFGTRPRIEGSVGVRRERNDFRGGFDNALLVGVGIPIGSNHGAVAEAAGAQSEALRAKAEAARVRIRLVAERLAADRALSIARRALGEAETRRAALVEALALTERGRQEGETGYLEVLRARQTVAQAMADLAAARVAALAAISTFNQALGILP